MSTQRGNVRKTGAPKHQNKTKFKNTLHDTSHTTKKIVSLDVAGVCAHCKEIIDWKIKYKKYKPLTQSKKCVKCGEKTVKRAYYIVCQPCATNRNVCAKCGEARDVVMQFGLEPSEQAKKDSELKFDLSNLSERKRRAFIRMQEKGECNRAGRDSASDEEEGSEDEGPRSTDDDNEECSPSRDAFRPARERLNEDTGRENNGVTADTQDSSENVHKASSDRENASRDIQRPSEGTEGNSDDRNQAVSEKVVLASTENPELHVDRNDPGCTEALGAVTLENPAT